MHIYTRRITHANASCFEVYNVRAQQSARFSPVGYLAGTAAAAAAVMVKIVPHPIIVKFAAAAADTSSTRRLLLAEWNFRRFDFSLGLYILSRERERCNVYLALALRAIES